MHLNIKIINITFHVSDFPKAVSFYEDKLGLQKKSQWHNYAIFDLCGMMLGIEPGGEKEAKRGFPDIYLQVENVDDTYRALKDKGVRFIAQPTDQTWGSSNGQVRRS
jgi:catechol 2,3-dioxygenase-like lactoylglutathione lyase family enzyme